MKLSQVTDLLMRWWCIRALGSVWALTLRSEAPPGPASGLRRPSKRKPQAQNGVACAPARGTKPRLST